MTAILQKSNRWNVTLWREFSVQGDAVVVRSKAAGRVESLQTLARDAARQLYARLLREGYRPW